MQIKDFIERAFRYLIRKIKELKPFPFIIKTKINGDYKIAHISAFNFGNAGDIVLPIVLQDLFNQNLSVKKWKNIHVSRTITNSLLKRINFSKMLIIGGGGLFLRDTNINQYSGWQWSCSIEKLNKINVPIIMFAVGYNRFRGQEEFDPIFSTHLNEFVKKAAFVGIRNIGSINKLKDYLESEDLKKKLTFQPCMTTLISKLYGRNFDFKTKEDFIAINCAFDREELRMKDEQILHSIMRVIKELSKKTKIKYYSHMQTDKKILPYLNANNISYELIEFKSAHKMIEEYAKSRLVIGMRGHAQMIPFGCNTPILSIISHDKLAWFLADINHPEWGIEIHDKDFESKLLNKSLSMYTNYKELIKEIKEEQDNLWSITIENMRAINKIAQK